MGPGFIRSKLAQTMTIDALDPRFFQDIGNHAIHIRYSGSFRSMSSVSYFTKHKSVLGFIFPEMAQVIEILSQ